MYRRSAWKRHSPQLVRATDRAATEKLPLTACCQTWSNTSEATAFISSSVNGGVGRLVKTLSRDEYLHFRLGLLLLPEPVGVGKARLDRRQEVGACLFDPFANRFPELSFFSRSKSASSSSLSPSSTARLCSASNSSTSSMVDSYRSKSSRDTAERLDCIFRKRYPTRLDEIKNFFHQVHAGVVGYTQR